MIRACFKTCRGLGEPSVGVGEPRVPVCDPTGCCPFARRTRNGFVTRSNTTTAFRLGAVETSAKRASTCPSLRSFFGLRSRATRLLQGKCRCSTKLDFSHLLAPRGWESGAKPGGWPGAGTFRASEGAPDMRKPRPPRVPHAGAGRGWAERAARMAVHRRCRLVGVPERPGRRRAEMAKVELRARCKT